MDPPDCDEKKACIMCEKIIHGKPWISVRKLDEDYHGCSYQCCKNLHCKIGPGYWKYVTNKEDFNEPRPVILPKKQVDITCGFDTEEIRMEIEREMEDDYSDYSDYSDYDEYSSSEESFDEENYL